MMTPASRLLKRAALAIGAALSLTAPAAADPSLYGDTLMWRLEPPGGGEPSYMVGTIHLADARLQPSIDRAIERLRETGALVVETDMSDAALADIVAAMMLTNGRTLPDVIGEAQFARLMVIAEDYGIPEEGLLPFAPWAVAMMLSVPADQLEAMATGDGVFDQRLIASAQAWTLPVETLEPTEEQIAVMSGYSETEQVAMLTATIEVHPQLHEILNEMLDAYLADDLAGLASVAMQQYESGDAQTDRVLDALITERNHRMAARVIPMLEQRPHLIAIGAMHLPGPDGVLNLLAEQGWTVVPAEQ
ncbi:MAG: TraB/GumN family protein [Alphaproteobacteria bacterium]